jgi:RNA polymerase sigma-70 factor (ECF subfamily)
MTTPTYTAYDDAALIALVQQDNRKAFDALYQRYWKKMLRYAYNMLHDKEWSREVVQDVFLALWEKRAVQNIATFSSYLYTSVRFRSINVMRDQKRINAYAENFYALHPHKLLDNSNEEQQNVNDLEQTIERSLQELPEPYRKAYHMSSKEKLLIPEIAARMNISQRTVANYLSLALKHLRGSLGEFMLLVWWLVG